MRREAAVTVFFFGFVIAITSIAFNSGENAKDNGVLIVLQFVCGAFLMLYSATFIKRRNIYRD